MKVLFTAVDKEIKKSKRRKLDILVFSLRLCYRSYSLREIYTK
jgi:hypothetical protein